MNSVVGGDLDSVVLSGWTLSGYSSGCTIHYVLHSLVVKIVWCHIVRPGLLVVKCVSASAFVHTSYHHRWDPFGTSIVLS